MRLWKGHIYAGITVLAGIATVLCLIAAFVWFPQDTWAPAILVMTSGLFLVVTVVMSALAYQNWMPKWERDEKRVGHVPGEPWERFSRALGQVGQAARKGAQNGAQRRREGR